MTATLRSFLYIVLYSTVILAFWTLSLWDAASVTSTYLYDNRVTLVKLVAIGNGSTKFLEDTMSSVTYHTSIFEQIWWGDRGIGKMVEAAYDPDTGWNETKRMMQRIDFSKVDPTGVLNLTQPQLIHAVKIVSYVESLDRCAHEYSVGYVQMSAGIGSNMYTRFCA